MTRIPSTTMSVAICVLWAYLECVLGETTTSTKADSKTKKEVSGSDMTKGLAAGFGAFIGMIVVIFILWCCCCVSDDSSGSCCCQKKKKQVGTPGRKTVGDKCKVAPSPPQSAAPRPRAC